MLTAATISLLLALSPTAAPAPGTVWLVEPLYPGQELLVTRSEEALTRLLAGIEGHAVGTRALAVQLEGKQPDLRCLTGEQACADPLDAFVSSLGVGRLVLLKGGQEDTTYRFRVTTYTPATGEIVSAEGSGNSLERALLGAAIKVVPLSSTLAVKSEPAGATVFVDGEKVGLTPYEGQILPGERLVRLELASHTTREKKLDVAVRGAVEVSETLEKVPARIVVAARPTGAGITVDGKLLGTDKVEQPIQPGKHTIHLALEGFVPFDTEAEINPGDTFTFEKELQPTGWTSFKGALSRAQEEIYARSSYFQVNYEQAWMWGDALYAQGNPFDDSGPMAHALTKGGGLSGLSFEYGHDGRYFGLMVVGAGYYHSTVPFQFTLKREAGVEEARAGVSAVLLRGLQPHLRIAFWRVTLVGQIGLEGRAMIFSPQTSKPDGESLDSMYVLDLQGTAQLALRAHIIAGAYVEGIFRHSWTLSDTAAFQGFHVGVGYAF